MSVISTSEFKNGLAIKLDHDLFIIQEFQHVKPGKGGAFVRTKLKNMRAGTVIERTFRAGDKVEEIFLDERALQFQYHDGTAYHFMDLQSYEEVALPLSVIGDQAGFLKDSTEVSALMYEGKILSIKLPIFVELQIVETEPGLRGDTSKSGTKPAKTEAGATVQVPLFIERGETIRVDTRTGAYISRA